MIKQCLSIACIFIVSITNAKAARQKEPEQPGKIQRKKERKKENFYGALIQGEVPWSQFQICWIERGKKFNPSEAYNQLNHFLNTEENQNKQMKTMQKQFICY